MDGKGFFSEQSKRNFITFAFPLLVIFENLKTLRYRSL